MRKIYRKILLENSNASHYQYHSSFQNLSKPFQNIQYVCSKRHCIIKEKKNIKEKFFTMIKRRMSSTNDVQKFVTTSERKFRKKREINLVSDLSLANESRQTNLSRQKWNSIFSQIRRSSSPFETILRRPGETRGRR